jgi:hypothetical protein
MNNYKQCGLGVASNASKPPCLRQLVATNAECTTDTNHREVDIKGHAERHSRALKRCVCVWGGGVGVSEGTKVSGDVQQMAPDGAAATAKPENNQISNTGTSPRGKEAHSRRVLLTVNDQ